MVSVLAMLGAIAAIGLLFALDPSGAWSTTAVCPASGRWE